MGAATARMFAREGAKVVIADVLEHEGRQVADGIGASARVEPRRDPDGIGHLSAFMLQYVGDHHFGSFAREHARRGRPHAGCRAGNDGNLARQSHDCPPLLRVVLSGQ